MGRTPASPQNAEMTGDPSVLCATSTSEVSALLSKSKPSCLSQPLNNASVLFEGTGHRLKLYPESQTFRYTRHGKHHDASEQFQGTCSFRDVSERVPGTGWRPGLVLHAEQQCSYSKRLPRTSEPTSAVFHVRLAPIDLDISEARMAELAEFPPSASARIVLWRRSSPQGEEQIAQRQVASCPNLPALARLEEQRLRIDLPSFSIRSPIVTAPLSRTQARFEARAKGLAGLPLVEPNCRSTLRRWAGAVERVVSENASTLRRNRRFIDAAK